MRQSWRSFRAIRARSALIGRAGPENRPGRARGWRIGPVITTHNQLHAPVILIWDNLNTDVSARTHAFTETHTDWLTVAQFLLHNPP
jgi:hypothetical protein